VDVWNHAGEGYDRNVCVRRGQPGSDPVGEVAKSQSPGFRRIAEEDAATSFGLAGADFVFAPYHSTGNRMSQALLKPPLFQFMAFKHRRHEPERKYRAGTVSARPADSLLPFTRGVTGRQDFWRHCFSQSESLAGNDLQSSAECRAPWRRLSCGYGRASHYCKLEGGLKREGSLTAAQMREVRPPHV